MNAKAFAQRAKAVTAPLHKSWVRPIRALGPAQDRQRGEIRQLLLRPVPQPKLVVSRAGDRDEQEADRVADRVLRLPEPVGAAEAPEEEEQEQQVRRREAKEAAMVSGSDAVSGPAAVQRNPASAANDTEPEEETEEKVQRQATETDTEKAGSESAGDPFEGSAPSEIEASANEEPWPEPEAGELESATTVQAKGVGTGGGMIADPGLASRITAPSGGHPLPGAVRAFMEPRLGYEFSHVRVHDAEQDRADAAHLKAQAFTYRNHIWLGRGQSADNRPLMAHELVHVVQQRSAVQRRVSPEVDTAKSQDEKKPDWDLLKWGKERLEKGLETDKQVVKGAVEIAKDPKKALFGMLNWLFAKLPGFALLTVVLGRNPFTGEVVERTPISLIRGFLTLLPNGEELYANLQKSRMLERTYVWLNDELVRLNITWTVIKGLVEETFNALAGFLSNRDAALEKLQQIFAAPLTRLLKFVAAVSKKVGELIFAGFLMLAGPLGEKVLALIGKAKNAFNLILKDPIGFVKNLMAALGQGFMQFKDRILVHLQAGLLGWLFGTLQGAGLQMPEKFDLKGLVSIVLQVLGLTYERLRTKLVKLIGEKRVQFLEKALTFIKVLGVLGKGKGRPAESGPEHDRLVKAGLADIPTVEKENKYLENGRISKKNARIVAKIIKKKHPVFKSIKVIDGGTAWNYRYKASPIAVIPSRKKNIFGLFSDELRVGTYYQLYKTGSLLTPHHIPGQTLMRDVSNLKFNGLPIFSNFNQYWFRRKGICVNIRKNIHKDTRTHGTIAKTKYKAAFKRTGVVQGQTFTQRQLQTSQLQAIIRSMLVEQVVFDVADVGLLYEKAKIEREGKKIDVYTENQAKWHKPNETLF